jgi:hypothetical protein
MVAPGWQERKGTIAELKPLLEFDEAVRLVFLETFLGYRLLLVRLVEVTEAYERADRCLQMDLIILPLSILSMSRLHLLPALSAMIWHANLITREAAHIGILQQANLTS